MGLATTLHLVVSVSEADLLAVESLRNHLELIAANLRQIGAYFAECREALAPS